MLDITLQHNDLLPLRDVVYTTLREAILRGKFKPGERLMEIKLASMLGVSRTPVREAIRLLEQDGLVIISPKKGAKVASITKNDLVDVLEIRCVLESLAVELACANISDEQIAKLKANLEEFIQITSKSDLTMIANIDEQFHDIIYSATGNRRLVQILNNLREQMYRYRLEYIKDATKRDTLVREHVAIIEALSKKDTVLAKLAVKSHITNQQKAIIESLNS